MSPRASKKKAAEAPSPWWGTFELEYDSGGRWDVGPSSVSIYHTEREWRVIHDPGIDDEGGQDPMADRSCPMTSVTRDEFIRLLDSEDVELDITRHSFRKTSSGITLMPALADRAIITRPENPLFVPPDESVTLYISTPLWIRIEIAPSGKRIREVPSYRMSDTWFGPSTREGELCYSTRTSGRLDRANLPLRFHRALTPLRIENRASDALELVRVQLPATHLSLFQDENNELWTEGVTMIRKHGEAGAGVDIRPGAPKEAGQARKLQEPRDPVKKNMFTSTFGAVGSLLS